MFKNFNFNKKNDILLKYANGVKEAMDKVAKDYTKVVESYNETHKLYKEKEASERIYKSVVEISTLLLHINKTYENLNKCVNILGKSAKAHRCYIFENSPNNERCSQIVEWCDEYACKSHLLDKSLIDIPYYLFPRWKEKFLKKEYIMGKVENFPINERKILYHQEVKSLLVVPIYTNGDWWGFIGFDSVCDREWRESEANALLSIANVIGTALKRDYYSKSSSLTYKYLKSIDITTKSIGVLAWHKDNEGKYITANSKHCIDFFGIEGTPECIEYITNKTDCEIIDQIYTKNNIKNTFGEVCKLSDDYVAMKQKTTHFIEAGVVEDEELLLYVIKNPIFEGDKFIGSTGIAWNISLNSDFIMKNLKRWIYDGHVKKVFDNEDVFCYEIDPIIKSCQLFEFI